MSNHLSSHSDITKTESVVCGASAGLLTRLVVAPFDMVKIRMQLLPGTGGLRTVQHVITNEGVRAFWKGNAPAELLYVVYSSLQFSVLRIVSQGLGDFGNEQLRQLIAGGIAGSSATFLSYPLDYLRTRGAANTAKHGLFPLVKSIYKTDGLKGFYHGAGVSVIAVFPYMALFFASYSYLRERPNLIPPWAPAIFTAASTASLFSKSLMYPMDTIRKKIQVHGRNSPKIATNAGVGEQFSHNFLKCGRQIVKTDGLRGLYRGLHVSLMKTCPGSFLSIYFYEQTLAVLRSTPTLAA